MLDFSVKTFSMGDIRRAGEVIAGDLAWKPDTENKIRHAFSVANNWRDSHALPMRSMFTSLGIHIRHRNLNGFTAARLKRMHAIRRKLRRMENEARPLSLHQLQDLGGCRAIMNTMEDVDSLVRIVKERFRHEYRGENDYIHGAKADGYRCHHLKYGYVGLGCRVVYNGRRIELQIRTALQHSWATAVEAIGLFRGEELKSGKGDDDWLRLFRLMSAEFAEAERCEPAPGMPSRRQRMSELCELNERLGAAKTLDNLCHAVLWAEDAVRPSDKPKYYLLRYDNITREVTVSPYFQHRYAIAGYENAESPDNLSGEDTANIVLVEADKMDNLTKAYPNYFGDVQLFKMQLDALVSGNEVSEFKVALQQRSIPKPRERPDPSWIGRRGMWMPPKKKDAAKT